MSNRASSICKTCGNKGFVNANGSANNAFEGSDDGPFQDCPECNPVNDSVSPEAEVGSGVRPKRKLRQNGYEELRQIHKLSHEAVTDLDKGEVPARSLIAKIREIAGCFPKFGSDNDYIGYARWRHRGDDQQPYLSICDSDSEGSFKIYRRPVRAPVNGI